MEPPTLLWVKKEPCQFEQKQGNVFPAGETQKWKRDYSKVKLCHFMLITLTSSLTEYLCLRSELVQSTSMKETVWCLRKDLWRHPPCSPSVTSCCPELRKVPFPVAPGDKSCSLNLFCSPFGSHWAFFATNKIIPNEWAWAPIQGTELFAIFIFEN